MSQVELLEELKKLPLTERLALLEDALHSIREDLQQMGQPSAQTDMKQRLTAAAEALLPDYLTDSELTAFTALDGEDFYAQE